MASFTTVEPLQLRNVTSTGRVIGKGAYGRVSEVYVHGTLCAAKEIHSILIEGVESEEFQHLKQSFLTECARNQALHHPNVVQMLGIHYPTREAILPWLVMEMMETSLARLLERCNKEKMPLYIKLSILVDISQGLEFLHGQDIIHRDLSSNNVLLTKHCVAKISDFGTAKLIMDHNRISKHTQTPGTLQFMPPEAISVNPRYGKSIDVFSLGCVSLHLMSHQWPQPLDQVRQDTLTALTEVERREEYLKLCSLSSLKQLIESCLHNEPGKRPDIATFRMKVKNIKADADRQAPLAITMNGLLNVGWQMNSHLSEVNSNGRVVGTGRYGRVLEVFVHGALYAAKEVDPHLFKSMTPEEFEATRTLFLMECATSQIHHPNVVQVLGIHYPTPEAKLPWLVMEMMEFSLTGFLEKYEKNEIPFHTKLSILVNISQGLEFLHGQDIIHRDLSSNNILLTKHCVAKIADLGVTKVVKSQTIHFLPPEAICYFTVQYGKPVDVFSFACITLHVLSHQWPEPSEQSAEDSMTAATEIQKREKYLRFFTQLSLRKLVESCLHSKPDQRPDIADVCRGLVNIKTANGRQLPLATANSIELYNAGWQKHLHLSEVISTGKVIGTGAYGWVLEVRACGTVCAAKEIDPYLVESISSEECEVVKKSFLECVNTSRIHHPNVVQVLGIHYPTPEAKLPWLVMEMMGSSLTGFLEKYEKDKVPLHIKLSILVDVSQGLEFLHCQSITHGNLSSNNVLLTKQQLVAKIADLGLAKVVRNSALKLPMEALGILHFTAPEALPVPEYSKPVDVFSLGCIACHVMSHQWPEPKDLEASLTALTEAERREEYLQSCTQSSLKHLVRSCLHNEPNQRPKVSAARVGLEHLRNVTADQFPLATTNYIELLNVIKLDNVRVDMLHSDLVDARTNLSSAGTVIKQMAEMIAEKEEKMQQTEHERKQRSFSENVVCTNTSVGGNTVQYDGGHKETHSDTFPYTRLSSIIEDSSPKNRAGQHHDPKPLENSRSSIVAREVSLPRGSKRRPRSNALSTPDADNVANAISIFSSGDNRGFNMSFNISNQRLSESHDYGLTKSLPDLSSLKVVTDYNPTPVKEDQPKKVKRRTLFGRKPKRRSLSYIADDDRYDSWQCAGCQQVNESTKLNCKGCGSHVGNNAIAESLCKGCKIKVYVSDIERLRSGSNCPMCGMPLGNTQSSISTTHYAQKKYLKDKKRVQKSNSRLTDTKANVWSESRNMKLIGGPFLISCDGQTGRYFVWREYGLQLYLPANCACKRILVTMSSYIPIKSQLSPGVHIVSSIYYLRTNIKQFSNFVTLHLQHCVKLKTEEDCQKMCFVIHNKDGKTTVDGNFHIGHTYGTIEVTSFCYIYIVWEADRGINIRPWPLDDQQGDGVLKGANSGPSNNGSSEEPLHPSSTGGQQNSTNGDHGNEDLKSKPSTSMESNKNLAEQASPTYVYEEMLVVPSNHLSIINKNWNGIYSIYRNLEGWRLFSIEVIVKEKEIGCPIDILTSEVEFDDAVATLVCNNISSDSWVVDCIPFEVKKSVVDQGYFQFKETSDPNYPRYHSRRMVQKSLIHVTKKIHSEHMPLKCRLIIKGVQPPQDIDLLTGAQDCITLYKSSYTMEQTLCDHEDGNGLLEKEPKMRHLIQFVIPKIKALWEDVAYVLLYDIEEVEGIKAHPQNDVKSCCKRLLIDWLSTSHGAHPKTWSTLLENLNTLEELTAVVDDIEKKLQHPTVIADYQ